MSTLANGKSLTSRSRMASQAATVAQKIKTLAEAGMGGCVVMLLALEVADSATAGIECASNKPRSTLYLVSPAICSFEAAGALEGMEWPGSPPVRKR